MTTALDAATVQIGYLCRERLHGTLLAECNKLRTKRGDDPGILFWRGFALGFQAKLSDAVDVFEPLRTKRDFALASVYAMLFFHRRQTRKDDGEIESLEIAAEMTVETANDAALYHAAALLQHTGQCGLATKLLDRMSRGGAMAGNSIAVKANSLRGWVELKVACASGAGVQVLQIESYFTSSLEAAASASSSSAGGGVGGGGGGAGGGAGVELDALLGLSACRVEVQDWAGALDALNRGIAMSTAKGGGDGHGVGTSVPFLVEKARVMMDKGDWAQAEAMSERVLAEDKGNVAALRLVALHAATQLPLSSLAKGAGSSSGRGSSAGSGAGKAVGFALPNDDDAQGGKGPSGGRGSKATLAEQLKALTKAMERHEAKNVPLFLATAQLFASAALEPRHLGALKEIAGMLQSAMAQAEATAASAPSSSSFGGGASSSAGSSSARAELSVLSCELAHVLRLRATAVLSSSRNSGGGSSGGGGSGKSQHRGGGMAAHGGGDGGGDDDVSGLRLAEESMDCFRKACQLDPQNVKALHGMIHVQLLQGSLDDAFEQLDLLKVMADGEAPDARLLLLEALVVQQSSTSNASSASSKASGGGARASLKLLEKAVKIHKRALRALAKEGGSANPTANADPSGGGVYEQALGNLCLGEKLFLASDPSFSLDMATLYLAHCGADGSSLLSAATLGSQASGASGGGSGAGAASSKRSGGGGTGLSEKSESLERALGLLKDLVSLCPSLVEAHLLTARATLASDPAHPQATLKVLRRCLRMDPSYAPAHLFTATVALERCGNLRLAQQSLDHALGLDFTIRHDPAYHVSRAKLFSAQGSPDQALKQLQDAKDILVEGGGENLLVLDLGSNSVGQQQGQQGRSASSHTGQGGSSLSAGDRAALAVEEVKTLMALQRLSEAKELARNARHAFRGTPFEVAVLMCEAEMNMAKGDAEEALRVLDKINHSSTMYAQAQRAKAIVHLVHRRDKAAYTACFTDMVAKAGDDTEAKHDALEALGQALLDIQSPGKAVEAFQHALDLNPTNALLAVRIGRALIATHDYRRARDYYDAALRSPHLGEHDAADLRHDLSKLLIKLRKYDDATRLLTAGLKHKLLTAADQDSGGGGGSAAAAAAPKDAPASKAGGMGGAGTTAEDQRDVTALLLLADVHTEEAGGGGGGASAVSTSRRVKGESKSTGDDFDSTGDGDDDDGFDDDDDHDEDGSAAGHGASTEKAKGKLFKVLSQAKTLQKGILDTLLSDSSVGDEDLEEQRRRSADVCCRLAEFHATNTNAAALLGDASACLPVKLEAREQAMMELYREAQVAHPMGSGVMVLLARLHLKRGEFEECQERCETVLRVTQRLEKETSGNGGAGGNGGGFRGGSGATMLTMGADANQTTAIGGTMMMTMMGGGGTMATMAGGTMATMATMATNPTGNGLAASNGGGSALIGSASSARDDAVMMLADVCFNRKDLEGAMAHLERLLRTQPRHYDALARLIQLLWRNGRLQEDVPRLLRAAENDASTAFAQAGLQYCKGLYHRLSHDPHQALHYLNKARRDGEWGAVSLSLMITIYLEPLLDAIFDTLGSSSTGDDDDDDEDDKGSSKGKSASVNSDKPVLAKKGSRGSRVVEVNEAECLEIAGKLFTELLVLSGPLLATNSSSSSSSAASPSSSSSSGGPANNVKAFILLSAVSASSSSGTGDQAAAAVAAALKASHVSHSNGGNVRRASSCLGGGGLLSGSSTRRHAAFSLRVMASELTLARAFVGRKKNAAVADSEMEGLAQQMVDVLEQDKEFSPAMLALSAMFMLQSQDQKARNMLKRIAKMTFMHDQSDAFERAYMVLAQTYVDKSKFDLAQDLCKKCLTYNQSFSKAHETLGSILERECAYKDAALSYEKAWEVTNQGSPQIGYELAFNYLKAKRFVEAIDVANEVIKRFPKYPKIDSDVLQVAIKSLRP